MLSSLVSDWPLRRGAHAAEEQSEYEEEPAAGRDDPYFLRIEGRHPSIRAWSA